MLIRSGKFLVILALVLTTGAHWAALQTVAWTTMLASSLQRESFSQAVTKTFDGEHPCCLCKAIAAAKKSERKSAVVSPSMKMEFLPVAEKFTFIAPQWFVVRRPANAFAESCFPRPPVPPPRQRFV